MMTADEQAYADSAEELFKKEDEETEVMDKLSKSDPVIEKKTGDKEQYLDAWANEKP